MTKNNNKKKSKNNRKSKTKLIRMAGDAGGKADQAAAMKYAQLLGNPCTGPLVHAPGSTEGGMIARWETDFIIGNAATDTAGFLAWTPGAYNSSTSVSGIGAMRAVGANDTTVLAPGNLGTNLIPGYSFLTTNASSYRCLAACMQVYWPGTELNRQGIVGGAQATYGLFSTAVSHSPAAVRGASPVVERVPTDYMEIKWAPNYSDGLFKSPLSATAPEDGHASLVLSWGGLPVGIGLRVRLVVVAEWKPLLSGLVLSSNTANSHAGELQAVRRMLDRQDANWWNRTGQAAANFLSGMTVAYAARRGPSTPRIEL